MLFPKKKQNKNQLSNKAKEVAIKYPVLDYLIDGLQMFNKSDAYKFCLKHIHQQWKHAKMELFMNIKIDGAHEAMLKEILKKWRVNREQYFSIKSKRIIQ